ncbi:MAG TPA: SUMF1/EgtB/PvdO family nonheme iron enzyme [Kiritimatiellia bacterium]|nr:SUMF1/EgtB/PvdO family nonheme iron enzyme [Kiritimatiellia bacterium]HSA17395.1 SUMF1/EgtB/PvdO family nonheme iron enzyme [Kiritimatiellia bacterium]
MRIFRQLVIVLLPALWLGGLPAEAATPRAFRLLSESNTEAVGLTPAGTLTWSNQLPAGRFQVEQNFNLSTGQWHSFISGPATATWHSLKLWDFNAPTGMVYIPAGDYVRGDGYAWDLRSLPVHTAWVSAIYMDRREVTKALWDEVRDWGLTNGFTDLSVGVGGGKRVMVTVTNDGVPTNIWVNIEAGPEHPVVYITWYDMAKWSNARSLRESLTPPYYTDTALTTVYRTGQVDLATNQVNWECTGYRLPTEAEWEKGARGGLIQHHYPWPSTGTSLPDVIDGTRANYWESRDVFDQGTTPAGYYDGSQVVTNELGEIQPVQDMANAYGLYDMCGNVWEWCWDYYSFTSYTWAVQNTNLRDIRGPPFHDTAQPYRVDRGGSWRTSTNALNDMRCVQRWFETAGWASPSLHRGFRTVRRPVTP